MSEDMYTIGVRTFNATIEGKNPIRTLFRDRYFPKVIESTDENVRLEVRRRQSLVLPAVRRGSNPLQIAAAAPHKAVSVEPPYHFYRADVTIADTRKRVFGEPVDKPYRPHERAQVILAEKLYEGSKNNLALIQEAYVSQLLKTGKVSPKQVAEDGTVVPWGDIEFDVDSDLVGVTLATNGSTPAKWTSTNDIIKSIQDMALLLFVKGKMMPTEMVIGPTALAMLRSNKVAMDTLDNRRIEGGRMETFPFEGYPGAAINGYLNIPMVGNIALISYVNSYAYPDDVSATKMIDDDCVLLTSPGWGSMGYGALLDQTMGYPDYVPGRTLIHTKQYDVESGFARAGFIQSAPLPIPTELDSWGYFKVV